MDPVLEPIAARWRELRQRYGWTIVDAEDRFLAEVAAALAGGCPTTDAAIHQCYNQRLYQAFAAGLHGLRSPAAIELLNRACQEIQQLAWRFVTGRGYGAELAEEISQELAAQIVVRWQEINKPGSFTVWAIYRIRALLKDHNTRKARHESFERLAEAAQPPAALASPIDGYRQLAGAMHDEELDRLLRALLRPFQYAVVTMIIFDGIAPSEVAASFGVKITKVYVEKSRALKKITGNPQIRDFLGLSDGPETDQGSE